MPECEDVDVNKHQAVAGGEGRACLVNLSEATICDLSDLVRGYMDPSRRSVLSAGLYSAALMVPLHPALGDRLKASVEAAKAGRTIKIGPGEVVTVQRMTDHTANILDELGGGHARPMAVAFLADTVIPWITADAPPTIRQAFLFDAGGYWERRAPAPAPHDLVTPAQPGGSPPFTAGQTRDTRPCHKNM
ncbi:hypothetical protein [Streptomyces griseocarneus]|uniref:hypothetical protein n=1 Tax=Streptomyces griseocarneus TaxID=51201 RepID=UPI00167DDB38|nr:hypothetical protein [Streptomyces griseocarneus]MBZ6478117.1 hypothetical protein [Streptomyces griseocarneus]GHG83632.1 hypothetical protein GCM10018779_66810 [Streptomyces griseocarneus]